MGSLSSMRNAVLVLGVASGIFFFSGRREVLCSSQKSAAKTSVPLFPDSRPSETEVPRSMSDRRPNFVVFFVDDLGYGDLGFTGHPTTMTPNLDKLAWNGKILTTWYSGCMVCTGSRAALMTGRQWTRTGLPAVLPATLEVGLPLNETTIAEQLKGVGYATGMVGKWHLGQRQVYLPGNRGFDHYLGIPYSDDQGSAFSSACSPDEQIPEHHPTNTTNGGQRRKLSTWSEEDHRRLGLLNQQLETNQDVNDATPRQRPLKDPAKYHLPLVHQQFGQTKVMEQPLDFTTLGEKYSSFATEFIEEHQEGPFFLYVPFSHVHTTDHAQPGLQYAGCSFKDTTRRGAYGDALAEVDGIVGDVWEKLQELNLEEDTLILFTSDNGPWLRTRLAGGSVGQFTGSFAGYQDTGKGSNWEGGIRMPAFAYWKGKIKPFSRSAEIVSSMDVFPTLSRLAGASLPENRVFDGKDFSDILLDEGSATSKHDFLFFYGTCHGDPYYSITAVRHGPYKAHWCTGEGLGQGRNVSKRVIYNQYPLLFDVEKDPSESTPISTGELPGATVHQEAMARIMKAYAMEKATFTFGKIVPEPDAPGEGVGTYGICCNRAKDCNCRDEVKVGESLTGLFNIGTKRHHDMYHDALGEKEPSPPRTHAQVVLQNSV